MAFREDERWNNTILCSVHAADPVFSTENGGRRPNEMKWDCATRACVCVHDVRVIRVCVCVCVLSIRFGND